MIKVAAKKHKLSTKLNDVESEFDEKLAELPTVRGALHGVNGFVRSIVSQSVKPLDMFISTVGTQLVDSFHAEREGAYTTVSCHALII